MKIVELQKVSKSKRGKFRKNNVELCPHEENTINYLTFYGFTINVICPVRTPKMRNPDILIDGAIWEMKSPVSSNLKTIKKRMHEASEQATRIIVDLRRVKKEHKKVESDIIKRFRSKGSFRRMLLITKDGSVFDYKK